jgi:hypothetical protein
MRNSATVQIVLDEYHALAPTLLRIGQVEAMEREIAGLKAALAAQMHVTKAEVAKAEAAAEHAAEVRRKLQVGKATAESRALRAEAVLEIAMVSLSIAELDAMRQRLAIAESKVADQAAQIHSLMTIRRQRHKGAECEREGCCDLQYARGLCIRHYQQERRAQSSGICPQCKRTRPVGRSGRCRSCYLSAVTTLGRDAARCSHV